MTSVAPARGSKRTVSRANVPETGRRRVDIAAWPWIDWAHRNQLVLVDPTAWSKWPNLERWFAAISARPAERARKAGKDLAFKTEFDEETARALFPQNFAATL
jgi:GSH-dependent disulfide-bond oxidoreductase